MQFRVCWSELKAFALSRNLSIQWIIRGGLYHLAAMDGLMEMMTQIPIITPVIDGSDQQDFENNFKNTGNQSPNTVVTTQYELNNKDLKLAKVSVAVTEGTPSKAVISLRVPGTFGIDDGRYIAGGDGWVEVFDPDDYMIVECYDNDRCIAMAIAQAMDPNATTPVPDEQIQQMGMLPAPINAAFPNYPLVKSYTETECAPENMGWFLWPLAMGNNLPPRGEIEFEPIAGYGHLPSGFYLTITLVRPNISSGTFRGNLFWGKLE